MRLWWGSGGCFRCFISPPLFWFQLFPGSCCLLFVCLFSTLIQSTGWYQEEFLMMKDGHYIFCTNQSEPSITTQDEVSQLQPHSFSHFQLPGFLSLPFSKNSLTIYTIPGYLCNIHVTEHHREGWSLREVCHQSCEVWSFFSWLVNHGDVLTCINR